MHKGGGEVGGGGGGIGIQRPPFMNANRAWNRDIHSFKYMAGDEQDKK